MHVASGIEGNMGAPLNSIWGSGIDVDLDENEDTELSDHLQMSSRSSQDMDNGAQ